MSIKPATSRYFVNPFFTSVEQHGVDGHWLFEKITFLASRICSRSLEPEEFQKGPYTGISGVAFALLHANETIINKKPEQNYADYVSGLLNQISKRKLSSHRLGRYLTGSVGDYVVQAICLHKLGSPIDAIVTKLEKEATELLAADNENEILNGRAGYLAGVLTLSDEIGVTIPNAKIKAIIDVIISDGRNYSRKNRSEARLMYEWHEKEYLGAAHGLSGILQMLLSFWTMLGVDQQADVKQTLDWFISIQSPSGNFPSSTGWIGKNKGDDELVHWCHGATGAIHMLICAHLALRENKYLDAAKRCANLIWERGVLRKGPGICHGVAGSGYAFLLLYRHTANNIYLKKAKAFARVLMDPKFEKDAHIPDMPWSLYEGWSGALCFLADLYKPEKAQFPLVPIPFPVM